MRAATAELTADVGETVRFAGPRAELRDVVTVNGARAPNRPAPISAAGPWRTSALAMWLRAIGRAR
jgi:hypothetical protein